MGMLLASFLIKHNLNIMMLYTIAINITAFFFKFALTLTVLQFTHVAE